MTPQQRAAALRLAANFSAYATIRDADVEDAAALLRELAQEPQAAPSPLAGAMAEQFLYIIAGIWHEHQDYSIRQTMDALNAMFPQRRAKPVAWAVFVGDECMKVFDDEDNAIRWHRAETGYGSGYTYRVVPLYAHGITEAP